MKALNDLESYITTEGPFDGLLGYSHGAQLAASLLLSSTGHHSSAVSSLKCAIFMSSGTAYKLALHSGGDTGINDVPLQGADPQKMKARIDLPTANVWGRNDMQYSADSEAVSRLCREDRRSVYIHSHGHEVPGMRAGSELFGIVRAMRRTIDTALWLQ